MLKRIEHKEEAITGAEDSQHYGETHGKHGELQYRALLKDIKALNLSGHYLEVGAGPGTLATIIAEHNPSVSITAVELSPDMVSVAKEHIKEKKLQDRIQCVIGDVNDAAVMEGLGKFDLVYSAFSLHHWKDPENSIRNLWNAVGPNGVLYLYDLKRVWWLYFLPLNSGFIESIRASYMPNEIGGFFQKLGINNHKITTLFPFFMQSVIAWK